MKKSYVFSSVCREYYLGLLEKSIRSATHLSVVSLGNLVSNGLLKALAENCASLVELRLRGPCQVK